MSDTQSRFYLEAAKFHYVRMEANLQDSTKFTFSLLAFLPIARSMTLVFKKEFNDNERLMVWYDTKVEKWKDNKIMRFFKEMRNVSLKEHTPDTRSRISLTWRADIVLSEKDVERVVDSERKEHWVTPLYPLEVKGKKVIGYSFVHDFKWFDENPDVVSLCKTYLDELEKFVAECENMIKKE
jgi:hypothetical protein